MWYREEEGEGWKEGPYWQAKQAYLVMSTGDFSICIYVTCTVHTTLLYVLLILRVRSPTMRSIPLVSKVS